MKELRFIPGLFHLKDAFISCLFAIKTLFILSLNGGYQIYFFGEHFMMWREINLNWIESNKFQILDHAIKYLTVRN